jgi:hypothetical protein
LGEFSPFWAIVYFGQFFEKYRSIPKFWATFSAEKIVLKMASATIWSFLTNSSGHPG